MFADQVTDGLMEPTMQYGAFGLCVLLVGVIFWMMRKLVDVLAQNSTVISKNTEAIERLNVTQNQQADEIRKLNDALLARPCIIDKK